MFEAFAALLVGFGISVFIAHLFDALWSGHVSKGTVRQVVAADARYPGIGSRLGTGR